MAGKQYYRRRAAARNRRALAGGHLAKKYAAMNADSIGPNGYSYPKAPVVRNLGWSYPWEDDEPTGAPAISEDEIFQDKVRLLQKRYAWRGPAWSKSGSFSTMLYRAQMAYDKGEGGDSRRHFNNALATLQAQTDNAIFEHGRDLMQIFIDHTGIIDRLPISPAEKEAERAAAIARNKEIEASAQYETEQRAIEALELWDEDDEALDQELQAGLTDGSFGGALAYAVGGKPGKVIAETGKGVSKALDPAEWLKTPFIRNLAILGALGFGAYVYSKR